MPESSVIIIIFIDDTQYKGTKIHVGLVGFQRDSMDKSIHKIFEVSNKYTDAAGQVYFKFELQSVDIPEDRRYMVYAVSSTPDDAAPSPEDRLFLGSCAYRNLDFSLASNEVPPMLFLTLHQI